MPANGTAGLARSAVSGISRLPSPPASTIARTFGPAAGLRRAMDATLGQPPTGRQVPRAAGGELSAQADGLGTRVENVRVDILSKEYPPAIYGGAGVHVAELVRALRSRGDLDVQVRCFGAPREEARTTAY